MVESSIWQSHLKPGEHIVWSAEASPALIAAARNRTRTVAVISGVAAALIALLLAARFFENLPGYGTADIAASMLVPLYGVFALVMALLAVTCLRRLGVKPPAATRFAATNLRLIALSSAGSITDELPAAEINGVIAGGRTQTPDIYVLRRDDPKEQHVFSIENIDRPLEAKAIIEDTFLEPTHEQAD